jgi:hypothetical protein
LKWFLEILNFLSLDSHRCFQTLDVATALARHEIYLERGGLPGNELDDWLHAERELERLALPKANGFSIKGEAR